MEFRLGELFSGPGGLGFAAARASETVGGASITHRWASDYDADTCETYAQNILGQNSAATEHLWTGQPEPGHAPRVYCADIRELDTSQLSAIDALAFGAPCNDHSTVGERKGLAGQYGPLYSYGVNVLRSHRPQWFLFENVGGIRGDALDTVMGDFTAVGYRLYPHYYDFSHYGVPQKRQRVIVIGIREDLDVTYRVPAPFGADVSSMTALSDIEAATHHEVSWPSETVGKRLSHIPPGGNAWSADLPQHLRIRTKTRLSSIYRRLDPSQPAYTVTGSGGGGTHMYHPHEDRALTNRERARLQSFPDDFEFVGGRGSVRRQIGMAVPPVGAQAIFEAVLRSFVGCIYPSVEPNMEPPRMLTVPDTL